jgi:hypothetical protein
LPSFPAAAKTAARCDRPLSCAMAAPTAWGTSAGRSILAKAKSTQVPLRIPSGRPRAIQPRWAIGMIPHLPQWRLCSNERITTLSSSRCRRARPKPRPPIARPSGSAFSPIVRSGETVLTTPTTCCGRTACRISRSPRATYCRTSGSSTSTGRSSRLQRTYGRRRRLRRCSA